LVLRYKNEGLISGLYPKGSHYDTYRVFWCWQNDGDKVDAD